MAIFSVVFVVSAVKNQRGYSNDLQNNGNVYTHKQKNQNKNERANSFWSYFAQWHFFPTTFYAKTFFSFARNEIKKAKNIRWATTHQKNEIDEFFLDGKMPIKSV